MPAPSFLDNRVIRVVLGLIAIVALAWAMIHSGRVAISRIFVKYGITVVSAAPLDAAAAVDNGIGMTPKDAEVHYTRGAVANQMQEYSTAVAEFEQAVSLRPRDYYLWIEVGLARDQVGDQAGALAAFNESVRLAPYYAQPRWKRGNLLFRLGKYDEAFADLELATKSDPELVPAFIDLAWGASRKDASLTEQLVQPKTEKAHSDLALFFARHGKPDEAVAHFKSAGAVPADVRRTMVRELLAAKALNQAFEVWSQNNQNSKAAIYDGGFEAALNLDESGFGWRLAQVQPGLGFSVDTGQPQSGYRSLRVNFTGHTNPAVELVSQLVLVEPDSHYNLSFAARTSNIVTGGPLVIVVKDSNGQQVLGSSGPFPANSNGWQSITMEFVTGATTRAVVVSLQREPCTSDPCPVFGVLNLDSFSLERAGVRTAVSK